MSKLDTNLYGSDPGAYASKISSDALQPPSPPRDFSGKGAEGNTEDKAEVITTSAKGGKAKGSEGN